MSYRILKPAGRRAGVSWVGFHTLRHTCASLLFEAGKNPKQVQTWLGHHDAGFTLKTYVHLMDEGVGEADFLDRAVSVQGLVDDRTDSLSPKGGVDRELDEARP